MTIIRTKVNYDSLNLVADVENFNPISYLLVFNLPEETLALLLVTSLALTTFLATFLSSTIVIQVVIMVVIMVAMIMGTDHPSYHNLLIFTS